MTATEDGKAKEAEEEKPKRELSMVSSICFGLGGMPYMICNTAINFYISLFILEIVRLQPIEVSIIVFAGKCWDALTDPVVGYLVSRSPCRLRGKFLPWILFSAPFASGWYFLFWYVPDIPREAYLPWCLMCYCLFQTFMTTYQVPYTSLTMYLSSNQKERDRATAFRVTSELVGVVLSVSVEGQLINLARKDYMCGNITTNNVTNATSDMEENISAQKQMYMLAALIFCGIYIVCALIVFFGVTEKEGAVHEKPEPFFTSVKLVFKHRPYVLLVMTCLFIFLANSVVQGNIALYLTHSVNLGDQFANLILTLLIASIVAIPLWHFVSVRFGKKTAFGAGIILQLPCLGSLFFIPGNVYLAYTIGILSGIGLSVTFFLPWSMLPDTLDEYMLKTGNRKDTIFYSFFVFLYKLASGLALALSQLILQAGGYDSAACSQPPSVGNTLRILLGPLPVGFYIIGLLLLYKYPVTKATIAKTKQLLLDRSTSEENGNGVSEYEGKQIESFDNPSYFGDNGEPNQI